MVTRLIASTQGTDLLARYAFILQWLGLPTSVEVLDAVVGVFITMADRTCQLLLTILPTIATARVFYVVVELSTSGQCAFLGFPPETDVQIYKLPDVA